MDTLDVPLVIAVADAEPQVGANPEPAEVNTWPDVPDALVKVNAVVMFKEDMVGAVSRTLLPVPVFATLTKFLDASVATALDAVNELNDKLAPAIVPVKVGDADNTLLPVPVFVTLTRFLDASVATALDAVSAEKTGLALNVAVPPTKRLLVIPTPPAVKIEPVEPLVVSVARLELMPCANGIRTVVAVCPSFVIAVDRPVAKSAVSALNAELLITVPVTTGCPEVLIWNVPEPL